MTESTKSSPQVLEELARPKTTLVLFLESRGLTSSLSPTVKPLASAPQTSAEERCARETVTSATKPSPPHRPIWQGYTKRAHGDRVSFIRRALAIPQVDYTECMDAYMRHKKPQRFIRVHQEADEVSVAFLYEMRRHFFEREVVDQPVCDLLTNREEYDEALNRVYESDEEEDNKLDNVGEDEHAVGDEGTVARRESDNADRLPGGEVENGR